MSACILLKPQCVDTPQFGCPAIGWNSGLFLPSGQCDQCCHEHNCIPAFDRALHANVRHHFSKHRFVHLLSCLRSAKGFPLLTQLNTDILAWACEDFTIVALAFSPPPTLPLLGSFWCSKCTCASWLPVLLPLWECPSLFAEMPLICKNPA